MGEVHTTLSGQPIFGRPTSMTITIYGPNGPVERYPVDAREIVEGSKGLYSYTPIGTPAVEQIPTPHVIIAEWFDEFTKERMLKCGREHGLAVHQQMSKAAIAMAIQESDVCASIIAAMREGDRDGG